MKRTLLPFSLWLCVAAFVGCCVLWALSYPTPFGAGRRVWTVGGSPPVAITETAAATAHGRLALGSLTRQFPGTPAAPAAGAPRRVVQWFWGNSWVAADVPRAWYGPLGFRFAFAQSGPGTGRDGWTLYVPWWFLCLLTGMPPAWGATNAASRRRRARLRLNLCRRCGYDLRATPGRCPECGTAAAVSTPE